MKDFDNISQEELAVLAQQGDREAEEYLIRGYKDLVKIKAHCYFIAGADAEDVVQEGMIGLFNAIMTYEEGHETSFKTYAELCINRQIFSAIRTAGRKKHSPLNMSVSLSSPLEPESEQTLEELIPGPDEADPARLMFLKDVVKYVTLNENGQFSSFELEVWNDYMQGKSYKEISEKLGKNQKAVYNAMDRIKKKIYVFLKDS